MGFADNLGATQDFAKITQIILPNATPFEFTSMDLRGRSDKDQWLTEFDIRARDVDNAEVITTVSLTDTWTTWTTADLGFNTLGLLKSITFFGESPISGSNNDRFALDNLDVAPIPEPTTMLLLGAGLIGLVGFRRKFKES